MDRLRTDGSRGSEEIDIVGSARSQVTLVGECKWTTKQMASNVLDDLEQFKLPALRQAGARFAASGPRILLFSKSGFNQASIQSGAKRATKMRKFAAISKFA